MIFDASKSVKDYFRFRGISELGFKLDVNDYDFERVIMFTLVQEALNGRKT